MHAHKIEMFGTMSLGITGGTAGYKLKATGDLWHNYNVPSSRPQALSVKNFKTGTWDEANYSVYFSLECAGLLTIPVVHIGQ